MALLTALSLADATSLAQAFGLSLTSLTALEQGSVNSNFRLETKQGTFFARIYEEQPLAGALAEMQLIRELAQCGVPTPTPLRAIESTQPVLAFGKPFAIYPWVGGEILCQARATPQHLKQVGSALAKLHLATTGLSAIPEGRFEPSDLERRLCDIERQVDARASHLRDAVGLIRQRLEHYQGLRLDLPRGVIHGDLFRDNTLWSNNQLTAMIDFESASQGTFAYDAMVCVHAWCFSDRFELDKVKAFFEGYRSVRTLGDVEVQALPGEGAIAALRFATTRITDFSLRAPPNTTPKRDYRRFLERLRQIEAGALRPIFEEIASQPE